MMSLLEYFFFSNDLSIQTERQCEVHSAQNRPSHLSAQVVQQEVGTEQLTLVGVAVAVAASRG